MGGISLGKLLVIAVVIALLFGTKRLRTLGDDLGFALRGFRKSLQGEEQDETNPLISKDNAQKR